MTAGLIDLWNAKTFDTDLRALLTAEVELICGYMWHISQIRAEVLPPGTLLPENPYHERFQVFEEAIGREMKSRLIRAFHYTRLIDSEVTALKKDGIHLSTLETLRSRLTRMIAGRYITQKDAEDIFACSLLNEEADQRGGKFWVCPFPVPVGLSCVERLLTHWGSEVATMGPVPLGLLNRLEDIGKPRVIELAIPLAASPRRTWTAKPVIEAFAHSIGCACRRDSVDLYVTKPLDFGCVLAVHSEGDPAFQEIGLTYPVGFQG